MKKKTGEILFGLIVTLFLGLTAQAANFTASADGDWSSASTWNLTSGTDADGIPDADDSVTISNPRIVTVTGMESVQNVTVNTSGTLTLNAGATLTLSGMPSSSYSGSGITNGSGSVIFQGTTSYSAGANFTAPIIISSGITTALGTTGGSLTVSNGATLNTTNQSFSANGDLTNNGTITKASGNFNAGGTNIINNGTITGGNFRFDGSGTQNLSGTGSITAAISVIVGSITTLTGDVTFGNGVDPTSLSLNPSGTLAVQNNTLTLNGVSLSGSGSITGTGAGNVLMQGVSSISVGTNVSAPIVIGSGTTTALTSIGGSLTVSNGATLDTTNQSFTMNGDLTNNGTITKTSGNFTASGTNIINNGTITGGNFRFSGSGIQNLSGTGSLTATISVSSGSITTLTGDVTFGNGVDPTSLSLNSSGTLAVQSNTLTLNGVSLSGSGSLTSTGAGKLRMQGISSLSASASFTGSLEINSGTTTATSSINGSLTVLNGATLDTTNQSFSVDGDLTNNGTITKTSGNFNVSGTNIVNNGTITGGNFNFVGGAAQTLSGTGNIAANATISSGTTVTLGSNHQLSILAVSSGGTINTANFILLLNGAGTSMSGSGIIANVNIIYNGSAAQTVYTSSNVSYNQLGIDNPAGVTLSAAETVTQRLILANGLFSNGANLTLANNATIARDNGTIQTFPTLLGNISVEYFGTNSITSSIELPASTTLINNLTINKTGGASVTLDKSPTVNGALTLTSGILNTTGSFTVFLPAAATSTGSNASYVNGTMQKTYAGAFPFTFHIGNVNGYSPLEADNTAGNGSLNVVVVAGEHPVLDATDKSLLRYWTLNETGNLNINAAFNYPQAEVQGNEANYRIFRITGAGPISYANACPASPCVDTVNNRAVFNNITEFSDWTVGEPFGPTAALADISGRVVRADGTPIAGVRLTANSGSQAIVKTTDANGIYRFPEMATSETYVITANRRGFTFTPPNRILNHIEENLGVDFVATRDLSTQEATSGSDFDGDGIADLAIFRPENGTWYIKRSSDDAIVERQFGLNGDLPTAGDYDGDGISDYAVFRPSESIWYLIRSSDNTFTHMKFGTDGDIPANGDYDGDGKTDRAVYRPTEGNWYIWRSSVEQMSVVRFGLAEDRIVPADYDGDGKTDVAVFRQSSGDWYILQSGSNDVRILNFGLNGDEPVSADYDGDGKTDIAVYRRSSGIWHILRSSDNSYTPITWGISDDELVPADYNGDGKADVAVFRKGVWYVLLNNDEGYKIEQFGQVNDKPIPNTF